LDVGQAVQAAPDPLAVQTRFHCLGDLIVWGADVCCFVFALGRGRGRPDTVDGAAVRHTSRRTSWATSSDWDGSRRTRRITPYTGPTIRSYSASNASWSPRATWTSRSSRS